MEKAPYNKIAIWALAIAIVSITNFLILFMNILAPLINTPIIMIMFSSLLTTKAFAIFTSLFILTVFLSLILSTIARKQIHLNRQRGRKMVLFVKWASIVQIILFIGLLVVYKIL